MASGVWSIPSQVDQLLEIFQQATREGKKASLNLESNRGIMTMTFKIVDNTKSASDLEKPGVPENKSNKKKSKAAIRRDQKRLEDFMKKKEEKKQLPGSQETVVNSSPMCSVQPSFKCNECDSTHHTEDELKVHMTDHMEASDNTEQVEHDKEFKCVKCNYESETEVSFTEHKREKHRIFECDQLKKKIKYT